MNATEREARIARNAHLEELAVAAEAGRDGMFIQQGRDGRAHYGRTAQAAELRADKLPITFRPAPPPH